MTSSMYLFGSVFAVIGISILGFILAYYRAIWLQNSGHKLHSRPHYYGFWLLIVVLLPSIAFLIIYYSGVNYLLNRQIAAALSHNIVDDNLHISLALLQELSTTFKQLSLSQVMDAPVTYQSLVDYLVEKEFLVGGMGNDTLAALAKENYLTNLKFNRIGFFISLLLPICLGLWALFSIKAQQRSRNAVEAVVVRSLLLASLVAILVTIGIVLSMLFQSINFFKFVSVSDFFFGTVWDPRFSQAGSGAEVGQFGLIPLLAGTLYIAFVAMLISVPLGLFAAIYMSEYASRRTRAIVKPLLEILAGIPTIVYGFFALSVVGPFLRDISAALAGGHAFVMSQSILTAGLVMGIMLIPYVSSLSDDVLSAVPRSLREGSLGLGATQSETIRKVLFPAALPGISSALLLTASRAIGETMIVTLAAGVAPNLTLNPFEAMTTITIKIVSQLTGDTEFMSPQTLVAFALGLTLFILTLFMNIIALYISRKYQEVYE